MTKHTNTNTRHKTQDTRHKTQDTYSSTTMVVHEYRCFHIDHHQYRESTSILGVHINTQELDRHIYAHDTHTHIHTSIFMRSRSCSGVSFSNARNVSRTRFFRSIHSVVVCSPAPLSPPPAAPTAMSSLKRLRRNLNSLPSASTSSGCSHVVEDVEGSK